MGGGDGDGGSGWLVEVEDVTVDRIEGEAE